jgi:hypothetical protein
MKILKNPKFAQEQKNTFFIETARSFHDLSIENLDFTKNYKTIIFRVLNSENHKNTKKIFQIYTDEAIKDTLIETRKIGEWSEKPYGAFCNMFDIPRSPEAINILRKRKKFYHKMGELLQRL